MLRSRTPTELQYGWIREMRYLPDFGRYEAAITLHAHDPSHGVRDINLITSVSAHPGEPMNALRKRLVLDAARLMRLSEVGLDAPDAVAHAA